MLSKCRHYLGSVSIKQQAVRLLNNGNASRNPCKSSTNDQHCQTVNITQLQCEAMTKLAETTQVFDA